MGTVILSFNKTAYKKTDINPNGGQIMKTCLEYMCPNIYKFLISQNISADLQGPKEKNINCTMDYVRAAFRAATQHNASCSDNK